MGDTSGVDGIDLYADVEDFNEDLDASGNAGGNAVAGGNAADASPAVGGARP